MQCVPVDIRKIDGLHIGSCLTCLARLSPAASCASWMNEGEEEGGSQWVSVMEYLISNRRDEVKRLTEVLVMGCMKGQGCLLMCSYVM